MECYARHWNAKEAKKDGKPLTMIDRIIMLRSPLTHSEFQFSQRYKGLSFSSTGADDANGTRFKGIIYSHPERWETDAVPFTDAEEDAMFQEACRLADIDLATMNWMLRNPEAKIIWQGEKHIRYDYQGILTHALKRSNRWYLNIVRGLVWGWTLCIKPSDFKAWCSEIVGYLVMFTKPLGVAPDTLDPSELHELLVRVYGAGIVFTNANDYKVKAGE